MIIVNNTLKALSELAPDANWLGAICRAVGGQKVELDENQKLWVNVINLTSRWMEEAIEKKKADAAERKRAQRSRERDVESENSAFATTPDAPPAEAKTRIPSKDEMVLFARQIGAEDYLPRFIEVMEAQDWAYVNRTGTTIAVTTRNFKAVLGSFNRQEKKNAEHRPNDRGGIANHHESALAAQIGV